MRGFFLHFGWLLILWLAACGAPQVSGSQAALNVTILADGKTVTARVAPGTTVSQALKSAAIQLEALDRVEPAGYTLAQANQPVRVIRVREELQTEQQVLAYEEQTVRSESLPEGETRLLQAGMNGLQEITLRRVLEDGVEINRGVVKVVILQPAQPEIRMVGQKSSLQAQEIPGRLVYLAGGDAWLMEESTSNRRPLTSTGDLDGYILRLSPPGDWLLFTRRSAKPAAEQINTLWALALDDPQARPIDLKVANVVHFAEFVPGSSTYLTFSTVEPRAAAPGWQANNDLFTLKFSAAGVVGTPGKVIEANAGGVYGWWGTTYAWSPDGKRLLYSRPDEIGLVSFRENALLPLLGLIPLQTGSDWALIPAAAWGSDSRTLYFTWHQAGESSNPEESPFFDLGAYSLISGAQVSLLKNAGMFSAVSVSPADERGSAWLAGLQALTPQQSQNSRYRLVLMESDGSNRRNLFPDPGSPGLTPQIPRWSPDGRWVGIVYQNNLWLIDPQSGQSVAVTADGLIEKFDWR